MDFPHEIRQFLACRHIVNIAVYTAQDFWAASCFYALDEAVQRLIVLTDRTTRHGRLMLDNPHIVGTISTETTALSAIEGVQFRASANLLQGEEKRQALAIYYHRHPIARLKSADVWALQLEEIKHTSNRRVFAQKTYWYRTAQRD
ncbi:hypothetical protein [Caviibacterium pharyngocola]|uniref:Uncharacterized protein n=1 Tax=Caviibacterium pharyngocola TaxID=28159 RepID=A0A2M8RT36_9PAST|nr:hypothetical protein [Caviibacterium pharyngocola]PJG82029.1 hypothetical protein CVP04_11090 [Caviibacterium pharyngocola]